MGNTLSAAAMPAAGRGFYAKAMKRFGRILLIAGGSLCVALGVVGIAMPILPTTPFLLLAAFCYARASGRFYDWLIRNRWCGDYIRNYREGRGIARRQKALTIALLWLSIGCTALFAVSLWWVRLMLAAVAVGVTTHILAIKTFKPAAPAPGAARARTHRLALLQE